MCTYTTPLVEPIVNCTNSVRPHTIATTKIKDQSIMQSIQQCIGTILNLQNQLYKTSYRVAFYYLNLLCTFICYL